MLRPRAEEKRAVGHSRQATPTRTAPSPANRFFTSHESRLLARYETWPLRFTARQTFLLERTRPHQMLFTRHESRDTNHGFYAFYVARTVHRGTEALQSFFLPPGVLSMKIMARDQGLDSFPASACEVKILAASDRLVRARSLQGFPTISRHFPRFPGISQVPPPLASSAPDAQQSSGRASSEVEPEPREHRTAAPRFTLNDSHLGAGGTSLPFSPCGEGKCVRGLSGRGASRAEEKGARNMAFKVFHESRNTKHESRPFFACFGRRVVRNAG